MHTFHVYIWLYDSTRVIRREIRKAKGDRKWRGRNRWIKGEGGRGGGGGRESGREGERKKKRRKEGRIFFERNVCVRAWERDKRESVCACERERAWGSARGRQQKREHTWGSKSSRKCEREREQERERAYPQIQEIRATGLSKRWAFGRAARQLRGLYVLWCPVSARLLPPICVTWLVQKCDVTHSHVCHYLFTRLCVLWCPALARWLPSLCVTWLVKMCNVTRFLCVPWVMHRLCVLWCLAAAKSLPTIYTCRYEISAYVCVYTIKIHIFRNVHMCVHYTCMYLCMFAVCMYEYMCVCMNM